MDNISSTFRSKNDPDIPIESPKRSELINTPIETGVEVPFTDYEKEKGHPYPVEYFKLGDNWDIFSEEITTIDSFIQKKIADGDISNTRKAVERELHIMEKLNNMKDEERSVVKIGVLSSYIKFINDTKYIKRYANY